MSLRVRILAGCMALTVVTGLLGLAAQTSQRQLGAVALDIYDRAFMAMSYLRAAQVDFAAIVSSGQDHGQGADLLADLDVASDRALSAAGRAQIVRLRRDVTAALRVVAQDPGPARAVQAGFDRAVEVFAADGFRERRQVQAFVAAEIARFWGIMLLSLGVAVLITALISRMVVPPIRHAVRVAQAIAAGRLDNAIDPGGRGESADLLRALGLMQASIAAGMARINALMAEQAASHAGELAEQNAQRQAAMDNMTHGLCLFDDQDRLRMANHRFIEMFGVANPGSHAGTLMQAAGLDVASDADGSAIVCHLADGRVVAASRRPVRTGGWVGLYEDITERHQAEQRMAHMARHDLLTGLPNRLRFAEHVRALLADQGSTQDLMLLCVDIDRFRIVNDTLGHAAGDTLLRLAAGRLAPHATGQVFRLGGNEFALLASCAAGAKDAPMRFAGQVAASFVAPIELGGTLLSVTVTIGLVLASDLPVPTAEALLACADLALVSAKSQGGGITRFIPEMDANLRARHTLELDLREAVARDQLRLFFQPQLLPGRGIKGFEALLRWDHPVRGVVSPAVFIPVAEETGLIGVLGNWVLRQACLTAAGWPPEIKIAVNISPAEFRTRAIVADVRAALAESGLPAGRLEIEITEAVLLADDAQVLDTLHGLRALGVSIAMDDFGTGYSSLGYLSRFPFDKIKIDQSFVRAMTGRRTSMAIVRAIVGLGHSLGMVVTAEGVETEEQMAILADEGCDELQGYLFSRPQPERFVADMLDRHGIASLEQPRLAARA